MPDGERPQFRLPGADARTAVLGMTGSGKSVFACWLLSHADYDRMPWLIVDHKDDDAEIFNRINARCITEIDPGDGVPKKPGLYIVKPLPEEDDDAMERTFRKIWAQRRVGVFVDEGVLMDPRLSIFNIMLTTGRSLQIPMIVCSQRPVGVSRYIFTQSNYLAVFQLETDDDKKTVRGHLGHDFTIDPPLFHCRWRDRRQRATMMLSPVDDPDAIVDRFNRRAPQPWWW